MDRLQIDRLQAGRGYCRWSPHKKKRACRLAGPFSASLQAGDVRCLQALGAAGHFELNRLAFVQRFVPVRLDSGKVDENVLAGLALDESESLAGIEPLHCSLFFHFFSLLYIELFVSRVRPQPENKKGRKLF
jgi:hypothetical protein